MIVLGIDPGLDGAIALIDGDGALLDVFDMPTIAGEGAKNRRSISSPLLAHIIRTAGPAKAYCELVGPRLSDGVVSAFGFGRSRGQIEGVLAALGVPVEMIAPPVWKRAASIPAGREHKDVARSRAISRWPLQAALFARKADCDRAEAALIAVAGISRNGNSHDR